MDRKFCLKNMFHLTAVLFTASVLLILFCMPVCAASAEITVKVAGGGVVKIKAQEGSPAPDKDSVTVAGGGAGVFRIPCDFPGSYRYRIWQEAGNTSGVIYDKTVYIADVFVEQKDDKSFVSYVTLSKEGSASKSESAVFVNSKETEPPEKKKNKPGTEGRERSKNSDSSSGNGTGVNSRNGDIQTGDTTPLTQWIIATCASFAAILLFVVCFIRRKKHSDE